MSERILLEGADQMRGKLKLTKNLSKISNILWRVSTKVAFIY